MKSLVVHISVSGSIHPIHAQVLKKVDQIGGSDQDPIHLFWIFFISIDPDPLIRIIIHYFGSNFILLLNRIFDNNLKIKLSFINHG